MIFTDKTSFISDPIEVSSRAFFDIYVTVTGPGPALIELLEEDGVWRRFPETTFEGPTIGLLTLKRGQFRVVIEAAEPTTVEVRL